MQKREEYIDMLAAQLKEWSAKIDELETKARSATADMRSEYEKQIVQLKEKRESAMERFLELKDASSEAWDTLKAGAESAWTEMKNAVAAAKEKFKKQPAGQGGPAN